MLINVVDNKGERNQETISEVTKVVGNSTHDWVCQIVNEIDVFLLYTIKKKHLLFFVFIGTINSYRTGVAPIVHWNTIDGFTDIFLKIKIYFLGGAVADVGQIGSKSVKKSQNEICIVFQFDSFFVVIMCIAVNPFYQILVIPSK